MFLKAVAQGVPDPIPMPMEGCQALTLFLGYGSHVFMATTWTPGVARPDSIRTLHEVPHRPK